MFAMFPFKIKILIFLKFQQQKYQEMKKNGLLFELRPSNYCLDLDLKIWLWISKITRTFEKRASGLLTKQI